jgi:hypothetical protein
MTQESRTNNYRDDFLKVLWEVKDDYYKDEEVSLLRSFINNYDSRNDFSRICFTWNGRQGSEFKDFNQDFRDKISIFICLNKDIKVPHILLRDLIQEIGRASRNAWGAPEYLFLLSEQLLRETKGIYIETFGEMLFSNMDTYGACISMDFTGIDVGGILNELRKKEPKNKVILDLIEYFESQV